MNLHNSLVQPMSKIQVHVLLGRNDLFWSVLFWNTLHIYLWFCFSSHMYVNWIYYVYAHHVEDHINCCSYHSFHVQNIFIFLKLCTKGNVNGFTILWDSMVNHSILVQIWWTSPTTFDAKHTTLISFCCKLRK